LVALDSGSEYEKQSKLNRFQGAAAISSNDYFDRDDSSGLKRGGSFASGDMDLSAADLVNRLSFQV
jgi:ADP-ribosylation factor GTPase-activating protein 2/3